MADLLKRALAPLLEKEANEPALDALLDAWRATREPRLAEAIDIVDAIIGAPTWTAAASKTTWTIAARKASGAVERGALIRAIAPMTSSAIVASVKIALKWDDPRVGTLVISMLKELRFSGARSQPFWRGVFEMIPKLHDPRVIDLVETLPQTWSVGPSMQRWLTTHLTTAAKETKPLSRRSETQEAAVAHILEVARGLREAHSRAAASSAAAHGGGAISGESLLADIYANPKDDAPRLVYADWLLERGDPRGELITLQLRPVGGSGSEKEDKASKKRERELIKQHKKEWLGRLAPILGGDLVFRRGFLASGTVKFRHQRDVEQYGSLPEWATVEELEWGDQLVRDDQIDWSRYIGPAMSNLKIARQPMAKFLINEVNPDGTKPVPWEWELEELQMWRDERDPQLFRQLAGSPRLAKLKRLTVGGSWWDMDPADWLGGVTQCPPELTINTRFAETAIVKWQAAAKPTKLETLVFQQWGHNFYRFSRDDSGTFTRLDVDMRPLSKLKEIASAKDQFKNLMASVKALPPKSITHFNAMIEIGGVMVQATDDVMELGLSKI